ncbi:hypothetical protein K474DRAFT_1559378, partial [Panus rudis PR-1116 ss-1]
PREACLVCKQVLFNKHFRRLAKRASPPKDRYKYVNHLYHDPALGEHFAKCLGLQDILNEDKHSKSHLSPFVRYAQGVASGKYKDNRILAGLLQSVMIREEKLYRNVGMQNIHWPQEWDHFLHAIAIESPQAYRLLQRYLPARSQRSFAGLRAKEPEFSMSITDRTFEAVVSQLNELKYDGPIALSCDDTKLLPSLRMCWSDEEQCVLLVGAIEGPLRVADPREAEKLIAQSTHELATKVRLFTAQVPLPGVAPILVAALPIGESNKAEDLVEHSLQIIRELIKRGVRVASYSCDGTEVERRVQQLLIARADSTHTYTIPSSPNGHYSLHITVPVFSGCPVVMVQDSKHGLKTFRNNLFSGARLLVLGQHVALYDRIQEMAFHNDSPLFERDVERLDRQDDNAAVRLFCALALLHLTSEQPEAIGEAVYLFIFRELIDAYQNRTISLAERLKLLLRTHYFISMWRSFLDRCGYPASRFFISREATDIVRILIEGL